MSDLNGLSGCWKAVTGPSSFGASRFRSDRMPREPALGRVQAVLEARRLGVGLRPQRLQRPGGGDAARPAQVGQPAAARMPLLWSANSLVVGEQVEHRPWCSAGPARRSRTRSAPTTVGVTKSPLRGRGLLDQVAAEQLTDQRLEDDVGGEDGLGTSRRSRSAARPPRGRPARPGRCSRSPGARCRRSPRSPRSGSGCTAPGPEPNRIRCMLFTEIALLCMLVGARRLRVGEQVQAQPVVHVHPRADVATPRSAPSSGSTARRPWSAGPCRRSG